MCTKKLSHFSVLKVFKLYAFGRIFRTLRNRIICSITRYGDLIILRFYLDSENHIVLLLLNKHYILTLCKFQQCIVESPSKSLFANIWPLLTFFLVSGNFQLFFCFVLFWGLNLTMLRCFFGSEQRGHSRKGMKDQIECQRSILYQSHSRQLSFSLSCFSGSLISFLVQNWQLIYYFPYVSQRR